MIITGKVIPRRTVLRGLGASVALPLLDSMVPALAVAGETVAKPVPRLGAIYVPNGIQGEFWIPETEGADFALTPTLKPLAPFRDRVLVVSGLDNKEADALPGEGAGDHSRGPATWLSGVHAKKTEGVDIQAGVTMDQIAAKELGRDTQLASLELTLESRNLLGSCDVGYSCAYQGTISWRTPTTPLPMEGDPRAVFERLFGDVGSTDARARLTRTREDRSILDSVLDKVAHLQNGLGSRDRAKLTEYLDAIRDVERRIQKVEEQSTRELPLVAQPGGIPRTFEEHAKLMFDLQVLAFQCDLTRVFTFMMGREVSGRTYPEIGVSEPHHALSHHQNELEKKTKVAKINAYHMQMFAYFLEKLRSTPDGEGSLLDHVAIVYGSGMSDGQLHDHVNLRLLVAGGGTGRIKGGRHLRFASGTPVANLHLTLLDKLGVPAEHLGDSTGTIEQLSAV